MADYSKRNALQAALEMARRALSILEEQAAGYTILTIPTHLRIELEEKRKEVANLETRLTQMNEINLGSEESLPIYEASSVDIDSDDESKDQISIFLSYAHSDQNIALKVDEYLTRAGFKVFRDTSSIRGGSNWDISIEMALRNTDCMVILLSPASMPYKKEVHREWFFYDQEQKPIFPLYIEECELHSRFYAYNYIDARQDFSWALKKLIYELQQPFRMVGKIKPQDRVAISDNAEDQNVQSIIKSLFGVIGDGQGSVAITPELAYQMIKLKPKDLQEYKLGRIIEWSQSQYQLNNRFIRLTLLVDQGEGIGVRWQETQSFYDIRNVLSNVLEPAIVLLGAPGSGKSTLLRRLQLDHSIDHFRDDSSVSFFIQLNEYRATGIGATLPPPRQWLAERWSERYPHLPSLNNLLENGRLLLLLDALNEMPHQNAANYGELVRLWQNFLIEIVHDNPGNRVVFSCRNLDYSAPLSSSELRVPQVRIEPMNSDQVCEFLSVYTPAYAESIWNELNNSKQLDLFSTPYFLKLLVGQIGDKSNIPTGKAELFAGFIRKGLEREIERDNFLFRPNGLLTSRDHTRILAGSWRKRYSLPDNGLLIPKLSELAFKMQTKVIGTQGLQVRVEYDLACKLLDHDRCEDILKAGISLNIIDEDTTQGEVMFFHQLLQEFFAARQLAIRPDWGLVKVEWKKELIQPTIQETLMQLANSDPLPLLPATGWEETTVLAATMTDEPDLFVDTLMKTNLSLAGRCAVHPNMEVSDTVKNTLRKKLIARIEYSSSDLRAIIDAGSILGELGDPRFKLKKGPHGTYLLPPLVDIAGADYPVGTNEGLYSDESPLHMVTLNAFRIGKFPVTNAEYAQFLKSGGYETDQWWETEAARAWRCGVGTAEGLKKQVRENRKLFQEKFDLIRSYLIAKGKITSKNADDWEALALISDENFEILLREWFPDGRRTIPAFWNDQLFNNPAQPVVGISWYEARAYCAWMAAQTKMNFRLPAEVEWEAATRGMRGRRYSHGNEFDASTCNTFESHIRKTTPVGLFNRGATPEGCLDMIGNVYVWTSSLHLSYPYRMSNGREDPEITDVERIVRGNSWVDTQEFSLATFRNIEFPGNRLNMIGFRLCVGK